MRTTLALLATAGSALAAFSPDTYESDCPEDQASSYAAVAASSSSWAAAASSSAAPSEYPSDAPSEYPSVYPSGSASSSVPAYPVESSLQGGPVIVTKTKFETTTVCPCGLKPTRTPGEVYTTVTEVEKTTLFPFEQQYSWGDVWTSTYTSYSTSTYTNTVTTTLTESAGPTGPGGYPGGHASGPGSYPSGSSGSPVEDGSTPGGYPGPSGSAPAGHPSGSASGWPSGSAGHPGGYASGSASGSASGYPGGYPSSSASGYPSASYPSSSGIWGTGSAPLGTGTAAPSKTCAKPKPTGTCKRCEGQPGDDKFCGYDINDNWYDVMPKTCNTIEYTWDIVSTTVSPDGRERYALAIDDGSGPSLPGPMIQASWGDTVIVHVNNKLPAASHNGTTIHFHGIRQNGTNEMDGVPSITQCPLAPGESQTYTWVASSYGSSWWHAHYALQTYEGIFGPMIIDGPVQAGYEDAVDQMVLLQDWSEETVDEKYATSQILGSGNNGPQTLDNGLINGKGVWENGGEAFSMTVETGKKYRLRLVNTAIQSTFKFHIDGHKFKVIAMDFVPIEEYETDIVSISIGQRYDLILEANQEPGNYWIRSDNQQPCAQLIVPETTGILNYKGVAMSNPTTTGLQYEPSCGDEPFEKLVPIVKMTAGAQSIDPYHETNLIGPWSENPNLFKWTLSGTTFLSKWEDPTLYSIWEDGTVPDYSGNLAIEVPKLGEWVYFIMDSPIPLPHPIHLHGHDFFVLAQGLGAYSSSVALNLDNPPRRDTAVMPGEPSTGQAGYLVIAYQTYNPGVWLLHCHIGWHNAMGFAIQIIENLEGIKDSIADSCAMEETCKSWKKYANDYDVFAQPLDSGV